MKIRYIIKHLLFRFSRAFYHARKFLAVFGPVLALLLSSFVVSAQESYPTDFTPVFYSDDAFYYTSVKGNTVSGEAFSTSFSGLWNETIRTASIKAGPYSRVEFAKSLYEDVSGEDIDNYFGYALPVGKTICVYVDFILQGSPSPALYDDPVSFGIGLNFKQDSSSQPYYVDFVADTKDGSDRSTEYTSTVYFTNNSGKTLYLNVLSFWYVYGGSHNNPTYLTFTLKEANYRYLTDTETAGQNIVSAIDKQTGEILNFEVEPIIPEGSESIGTLDDAEQSLISGTSDGFNQVENIFTALGGYLETYAPAFAAIGNLFMSFAYIPFFHALLYISLAFGLFALLVNLGFSVKSSFEARKSRELSERREFLRREARRKNKSKNKGGGK